MENTKNIEVSELLVLCDIIDEYEEFSKNLSKIIKEKSFDYVIHNLVKIYKKKYISKFNKVNKFYQSNKATLDKINKHNYMSTFILNNYDNSGNIKDNSNLEYYHKYLLKNKENIEQIKSLLTKLKELEIDELEFDKNRDFTSEEYKTYIDSDYNKLEKIDFYYLDNMEAIPNYDIHEFKYKTTGSNYKIHIRNYFYIKNNYEKKILLNSLTFDPKRLPDVIDKKSIFEKIKKLQNDKKEEYETIRNSEDLTIVVNNMTNEFNSIKKILKKVENYENKEQLNKIMNSNFISELKKYSDNYNKQVEIQTKSKQKSLKRNK